MDPIELLQGHPVAFAVYERVLGCLDEIGPVEVRTSKSQIAFWRTHGFAYLWLPGQYLSKPGAEIVLTIALGREDHSARFKEVAHPAPKHWMHHLEVHRPEDIDDEVIDWLREAAARAG